MFGLNFLPALYFLRLTRGENTTPDEAEAEADELADELADDELAVPLEALPELADPELPEEALPELADPELPEEEALGPVPDEPLPLEAEEEPVPELAELELPLLLPLEVELPLLLPLEVELPLLLPLEVELPLPMLEELLLVVVDVDVVVALELEVVVVVGNIFAVQEPPEKTLVVSTGRFLGGFKIIGVELRVT